ncbi:MAG TPA: ribosome recycling factor [Patescibacteria group bacterium]|nr:ribosome recycling factor [Patescibacteria group bacterium]
MSTKIEDHRQEFQQVADHFHKEIQSLRTGRASAGLVEDLRVEAYGQSMDLKSVASITTPDAKTIQIEPWDKSIIKDVEKALIEASLGMQPNTAGTTIRLVMPPMTEENRKNLVKTLHQKTELAKVGVRNLREKIKSAITDEEKKKEISEDEKRRKLEQLDKVIAEWNTTLDKLSNDKEKEILTI